MYEPKAMPSGEELRALQEVTIKLPQWCINQLQNMKDFVNNATSYRKVPVPSFTVEDFLANYIQSCVCLDGQKLNSIYRF